MMSERMTSLSISSSMQQRTMATSEDLVARLIASTQELLEILNAWTFEEATYQRAYDIYNTIHRQYMALLHHFKAYLLPVDDLLPIPKEIQTCLISISRNEPSQLEHQLSILRELISKLVDCTRQKQHVICDKLVQVDYPIYLKWGHRVKRVTLDMHHTSIEQLRQLFLTYFGASDKSPLQILDPITNIEYELETINDIQPYSVDFLQHTVNRLSSETEIEQLRAELEQSRKSYLALKQSMQEPKENRKVHQEITKSKEMTQRAASLMSNRLEELQDIIDQLKSDVTQRRCRPSKSQLVRCKQESDRLEEEMKELEARIKRFKPFWKKTWELELQQIVKEQQFLREQEGLICDLKDDHKTLIDVLEQLNKIAEIQERKRQQQTINSATTEEEEEQGMIRVLGQVASIHVDHHQRMKALDDIERKLKLKKQKMDEFERELTDFVGFSKLRNVGGTEVVERERQQKDKAMIHQLFAK
ncbi:actin interacting protein 3-domain-containing protein [Blakeslea trispora]|nr:actin interacting protein 3-domain-containing protein [Blakeslea trispora]